MSNLIVYALSHPVTDELRYIGKSERGMTRPREHGSAYNMRVHSQFPVVRWIKKLRDQGLDYKIEIIEEHRTRAELLEAERFYISYFRSLGMRLLNICEGGEGFTGFHRPESREKMRVSQQARSLENSQTLKRLWQDPEYTAKVASGHQRNRQDPNFIPHWTGRHHTFETCVKMSAVKKMTPLTEAQRRAVGKMIASNVGRKQPPRPPEWCAKLGRVWTEEEKQYSSWAHREHSRDPRVRAQLAKQSQDMWNDPEQRERMLKIRREQWTPELRARQSEINKRQFETVEARNAMALKKGARPFVDQHGTIYINKGEAARQLGLERTLISKVLRGQRTHTGGYKFKYLEV